MSSSESRAGSKGSATVPASDPAAFDKVQTFIDALSDYQGWGGDFTPDGLKLVSASAGPISRTVFEFKVQRKHCNGLRSLHGGCAATLFDWCTTTALMPISKPGFWRFSVSRTLNVTYMRPIPEGEVVLIESEVVHAGKNLASLRGSMRRKSDGAVLTLCEHGKVNIDPPASKL